MDILRTIITIIYVVDCIILAGLVLRQEGKQQGLGSIAGIADSYWEQNKGRSKEGRYVLGTKISAVVFIALSVVLNLKF